MRRRKGTKVRRTWEERQKCCMQYMTKYKNRIRRIIIVIIDLLFVLLFLYRTNINFRKYEAEIQEKVSQIDIKDYVCESKRSKVILYLDSNPFIKITMKFRMEGGRIYYTINDNLTIVRFITDTLWIGEITIVVVACEKSIFNMICFLIYLFTEIMSHFQNWKSL